MTSLVTTDNTFTALYEKYRADLLCYASHYCGNDRMLAEDIVQDVFLQLWLKRDSLVIGNLRSYLFAMVRNKAVDFLHRHGRYQQILELYGRGLGLSTSHDALLEKEYRERLLKAIKKLPDQQSLVYELRCVYEWKYEKVADAMNISTSTVKKHMQVVKRKLMKMVA